jgi:hypothetical protein
MLYPGILLEGVAVNGRRVRVTYWEQAVSFALKIT